MRTLSTIALITALLFALSNHASADCGLQLHFTNFTNHGTRARDLAHPVLSTAVNDCFNRGKEEAVALFQRTHNTLRTEHSAITTATSTYLLDLGNARKQALNATRSGTDQARAAAEAQTLRLRLNSAGTALKAALSTMSTNLEPITKALRENESRMTSDGFTLSDKRSGNGYKYPNCNPERNNQPAQNWTEFRTNYAAVKADLTQMQSAVDCHMREMGVQ